MAEVTDGLVFYVARDRDMSGLYLYGNKPNYDTCDEMYSDGTQEDATLNDESRAKVERLIGHEVGPGECYKLVLSPTTVELVMKEGKDPACEAVKLG